MTRARSADSECLKSLARPRDLCNYLANSDARGEVPPTVLGSGSSIAFRFFRRFSFSGVGR